MTGSFGPKPEPDRAPLSLMRYSHLGMQFALSVGLLVAAGLWADGRWGTTPLFTLLGVGAGFGVGFYHLYKSVYGFGASAGPGKDAERPGPGDGKT